MSEVRRLVSEAEFAKFVDIVTNAYPGMMGNAREEKQKFKEFLITKQQVDPSVDFYGLFREQQLIAGMRIHYYEMNVHDNRCEIGGVGLVAVDLLHKKEHAAKELIEHFLQLFKAKGVHLVALYPFRPDFYKKMGFGYGSNKHQYLLEPASFPKGPTKERLHYANKDAAELLQACYNRYAENRHGMIFKTACESKALFQNKENRIIAFKKDEKVQGYLVFTFQNMRETNFMLNNLIIKEWVYETPEALLELSTFLNSQADQVSRIEWNTQDENIRFLVKDARNGSSDLIPSVYHPSSLSGIGLMYRIIDVKSFIQQLNHRRFYGPDFRCKLTVKDSFFPDNQGGYVLQLKQGSLEIVEDEDFEVEVKIDISELSSLLMGVVSLKELYMYSKVEISDSTYLNKLENIFISMDRPICMTTF